MNNPYNNLNDAASNQPILAERKESEPFIEIHYAKNPSFTCDGIFVEGETHAKVGEIGYIEDCKDRIFQVMQGEFWSPQGEARELIQGLELKHTSMSIGDVIVVHKDSVQTFMIDNCGWKLIDDSLTATA